MNQIRKTAFMNASITALYIVAVALFMNFVSKRLSHKPDTFLDPVVVLLLFVFSAAFTSYFMFGKSALMYLDGKKKEAISVATYTIGILFGYTILAIALLFILQR